MGNVRTGIDNKKKNDTGKKVVVGSLRTVLLERGIKKLSGKKLRKDTVRVKHKSSSPEGSARVPHGSADTAQGGSGTALRGSGTPYGQGASNSGAGTLRGSSSKAVNEQRTPSSTSKKKQKTGIGTLSALRTAVIMNAIHQLPPSEEPGADAARKAILYSYAVPAVTGMNKFDQALRDAPGKKYRAKLQKKEIRLEKKENRQVARMERREEKIGRLKDVAAGNPPSERGRTASGRRNVRVVSENQRARAQKSLQKQYGKQAKAEVKLDKTRKKLSKTVRKAEKSSKIMRKLIRWIVGLILSFLLTAALVLLPYVATCIFLITSIQFNVTGQAFPAIMAFTGDSLKVKQFLEGKGLNDTQIAAIIGTMCVLTTGTPGKLDASRTGPNGGIGILQWTGEKKEQYKAFCDKKMYVWQNLDAQLEFFWQEYKNTPDIAAFESESDLAEATEWFATIFASESSDWGSGFTMEQAKYAATKAMNVLNFKLTGNGEINICNGIPYFNQADYDYVSYNGGTVRGNGCGICSFSMVATAYTGMPYTPEITAPWAMANGANTVTSWDSYRILANAFGISQVIQGTGPKWAFWGNPEEKIVEALQSGYLVIGSQTGGIFNPSNSGHYIVYAGVTADGRILVNDPGNRSLTYGGSYSYYDAFANCKQYWIFIP